MISFEPDLTRLRPTLGDAVTDALVRRERREVFSVYPELRIAAWAGAMLVATAAGIVLKNNLERIGPLALAVLLGLAAAACYVWTWWRRDRATLVDDYVLLLGALLLSADVGFIEQQFKVLGDAYARHFLFLAVVHGTTAYAFKSRMVLSLSISALATWLGVEWKTDGPIELAGRAFVLSAILLTWRALDQWQRPQTDFAPVFEHFAALAALTGGFALMFDNDTRTIGCLVLIAIAALVMAWGFRTRAELFVLYAFVCAVIAVDVLLISHIDEEAVGFLIIILSMIAAIVSLIVIHGRFRRSA